MNVCDIVLKYIHLCGDLIEMYGSLNDSQEKKKFTKMQQIFYAVVFCNFSLKFGGDCRTLTIDAHNLQYSELQTLALNCLSLSFNSQTLCRVKSDMKVLGPEKNCNLLGDLSICTPRTPL